MRDLTSINLSFVDTDEFIGLPLEAQALYFHLLLRAEDDGLITNAKAIVRAIRCTEHSLELLEIIDYVRRTEEGLYYITNWDVLTEGEVF